VLDLYPRGLIDPKGAVPGCARGHGHTAPTYVVGFPGSMSHGPGGSALAASGIADPVLTVIVAVPLSFTLCCPDVLAPMTIAPVTIAEEKQALRRAVLARRDALDPAFRARASGMIAELALALSGDFVRAPVSIFWPMRSEVDTRPLMAGLVERSFQICLPVVAGDRLRFAQWRPGDGLRAAGFGLQEPLATAPSLLPTTLLVPLCAFDRQGNRLGYGKGFYDRTIAAAIAQRPLMTIGIAFSAQEISAVPIEPHDRRLNAILTEAGLTTIATGSDDRPGPAEPI
jgi:5-formyltetrahydrofolate cyclo-ligase